MAGTSLGTAYVQIVPSADGIKGSLTNLVGGEAESAGTIAGSKLGVFAKKALKKVAIGTAVLTSLKTALSEGSELEQLRGGVEKIFDGANTSQIFADASNAYKDLNLSASDYLSTITSAGATFASTMGDQKGYEVARAGMLAVSDFATGTGKDVGLLNEKFQMISRSTSSYQSIADQFAGLLPQTSSEFLSQAQAAGFLSDEYTSLTDVPVAEYQEALVQMMQRGTESMGLAGNTALETEKTFSGSLEAMKASVKNVFGSLALGEDIKPALQGLLTSVDTFVFDNLIPMIGTIVKGLPTVIWTFLSEGVPMLLERISSFLETGAETLKGLASNLSGEKVKAWAVETIPKLITAAGEMIKNFAQSLVANLPEIINAIGQIAFNIVTGLGSALWPKIRECAIGIKDRFMEPINDMRERVHNAIQALKDGFLQRVYSIRDTIGGVASTIRSRFLSPIENLRDKVKGIIDKIKSFFRFSVSIPHIPLPHFYISPSGWRLGDLLRGSIPSLGISWYAKGGIATNPSIVGIGEGTSNEAILPLDPFWKRMDKLAESVEKNGRGGDVTINVYAAPGMDVNAIAEAVERKMISAQNSRRVAWGV